LVTGELNSHLAGKRPLRSMK